MSASLANAAPIRFLVGVVLLWTVGRAVALVITTTPAAKAPGKEPQPLHTRSAPTTMQDDPAPPPHPDISLIVRDAMRPVFAKGPTAAMKPPPQFALAAATPANGHSYARSSGAIAASLLPGPGADTGPRLSGSAWIFLRGGDHASPLSPVGQIGGSQAGGRILYRLDEKGRIALSGRLSRAIGGPRQTEAATGIDWKPLAALPVHLMLDRRIAIDRGGRNAWTIGAAGGVDAIPVAPGWRLDGYAEAGVVGARSRDPYADGAIRIARAIDLGGGRSIALGGGGWAAAQPHAARIDIGPSAVLRLPVSGRLVAVALDWRQRVAGTSRPGSGIALTIASDF